MREIEHVVRECVAMAEEELWSGWNQVEEEVQQINHGNWKKPKRGIKREESKIRQKIHTHNETILGRCAFVFNEEGHGAELDFEATKWVNLGEEHCWTAQVKEAKIFSGEEKGIWQDGMRA